MRSVVASPPQHETVFAAPPQLVCSPPFWQHQMGRRRTESPKHERHHPSQCQDGVPLEGRAVWEKNLVVEAGVEMEEVEVE